MGYGILWMMIEFKRGAFSWLIISFCSPSECSPPTFGDPHETGYDEERNILCLGVSHGVFL
uniref:Uncharacterized protein n=1 Tax=Kalanchoe fedtschenkoi TaxID=63787 RepID=A0A7N0ZTS7_KALFE